MKKKNIETIHEKNLIINNIFDAIGVTEAEEGSIPANGIVRGRPLSGRSLSMSIKFDF